MPLNEPEQAFLSISERPSALPKDALLESPKRFLEAHENSKFSSLNGTSEWNHVDSKAFAGSFVWKT